MSRTNFQTDTRGMSFEGWFGLSILVFMFGFVLFGVFFPITFTSVWHGSLAQFSQVVNYLFAGPAAEIVIWGIVAIGVIMAAAFAFLVLEKIYHGIVRKSAQKAKWNEYRIK